MLNFLRCEECSLSFRRLLLMTWSKIFQQVVLYLIFLHSDHFKSLVNFFCRNHKYSLQIIKCSTLTIISINFFGEDGRTYSSLKVGHTNIFFKAKSKKIFQGYFNSM